MKILSLIVGLIAVLFLVWVVFFRDNNQSLISDVSPRPIQEKGEYTIIAFGDSLTAGYGLPAAESYPAQLEIDLKAKGHSVSVINSGVSGETTRGNLERATFIREQNPDIVLLGIGGNDALRLLPIEETKKNIKATVSTLKSGEDAPIVILLRMQAPLTAGLGYKREFDGMYEEIAEEYSLIVLPFITADVFLSSEYKLSDGIHFNKAGYQKIVAEYLAPTLTDVLTQLSQ